VKYYSKSILKYKKTSALVALVVFILSLIISPYYILGDQENYRKFYEEIPSLNFIDGFLHYSLSLSSKEPGYYTITWIFSRFLEKDLFISILNAILAFYSMQLLIKWRASIYVAASIVLTNFYFYVLFFAAERLKVSVMFLTIALLYVNGPKFYFFSMLSIISHIQTLVVYVMLFFRETLIAFFRIITSSKINKLFLLALILLSLMLVLMSDQIITKFKSYALTGFDIQVTYKMFIFYFMSLVYSRNKLETTILFIPLIIGVLMIGGTRINTFGYFVFLYYALPINKGFNIGVVLTSVYFFIKNIIFVHDIIVNGHGW
jgi:hypothetical protein